MILMRTPVFSFATEILTDAPFDVVVLRVRDHHSLRCLQPFGPWSLEEDGGVARLSWSRSRLGSAESGVIRILPHERGAHLQLEARHKGWTAFGSFGILRWHGDQLLERLIEELG